MASITGSVIAAGLGAAGSIGGALIGSGAAHDAASAQLAAAQAAAETQWKIYNQTRSDLMPYQTAGQGAIKQLQDILAGKGTGYGGRAFSQLESLYGLGPQGTAGIMKTLQGLPGYQFQLQQGQQGIDRGLASRGLALSGAQLKDASQFNQGLASTTFQQYLQNAQNNFGSNFVSPLQFMGQLGENAGAQTGAAGSSAAQGIANAQLAGGQAQASGIVGGANAWTGGLQSALQNALFAYNAFGGGGGGVPFDFQVPSNTLDLISGSGGGFNLSDRRAKTNIRKVGKTDEGDNVYLFRYRGRPETHMGVMAQEVAQRRPDAVASIGGVLHVAYDKLSPLEDIRRAA